MDECRELPGSGSCTLDPAALRLAPSSLYQSMKISSSVNMEDMATIIAMPQRIICVWPEEIVRESSTRLLAMNSLRSARD